jgi:iron complex outermembrane receptor protein
MKNLAAFGDGGMGRFLGTMRRAAMTSALGVVIAGAGQIAPSVAQSQPAEPSPGGQSVAPLPEVRVTARRARQRARPAAPQQQAAPPSAPVETETANGPVRGYVAGQSGTATKTDAPILTTPQSISVVTQDQIATQQAQSMNEALRYTPGVITEPYGASSTSNDIKVRGFLAPRYLDGLKLPIDPMVTFAQTRIEPWGLERIEVLKGPSSGLYGETSPGGLISMVSKRPTPYTQNQIELQTGSFGRAQGAFDFSGPLDKDKEFLYRFVGLTRLSDNWIDYNTDNRLFLAPSFTWRPTNDTNFTVLASYTRDQVKGPPQQYVPAVGTLYASPLGRIPYNRNLGEPDVDRTNGESAMIGYSFEHRFNSVLQFRQNLRYAETKTDVVSMRNETGDPSLTGGVIQRSANYVYADSKSLTIDNHLQADFRTGPLVHKVLAGVDYVDAKSTAIYSASTTYDLFGNMIGALYPLNAYAPVYGQVSPNPYLYPSLDQTSKQSQVGVYVQDEVKLDRFTLTLTGRHDQWQADTVNNLPPGGTIHQDFGAWTGRAGLSYLFDNGLSPYVSYSTSFQPLVGLTRANFTGEVFKPTTGEGKEVGIKFQPPGTKALFTMAAFDVKQQNVLTTDPSNPFLSVQTGEVTVKGFEMDMKASLSNEIDIVGGYTYLEPIVTGSNTGNVGKDVVNIPRNYASLWGFYTFRGGPAAGLGLGAGVRYIGSSFADDQNLISVPSYGLVDAAISYDFGYYRRDLEGLKLQVNATNLFNKYYVSTCFTGLQYCGLGAPRRILATLKYSWN